MGPNWMNFVAAVLFFVTALWACFSHTGDFGLGLVWLILGGTCVAEWRRRRSPAAK